MAKKGRLVAAGVAAAVLLLVVLGTVSSYNGLVAARTQVDQDANQVGVAYARKLDLLGPMEDLAAKAMRNETAFVERVTALRAGCSALGPLEDHAACEQGMKETGKAMIQLINERYPELRSVDLYRNVQTSLVESVNIVFVAQTLYNEDAGAYNAKVQKFPSNLVAGLFGFETRPYIGTTTTGGSAAALGTNNLRS